MRKRIILRMHVHSRQITRTVVMDTLFEVEFGCEKMAKEVFDEDQLEAEILSKSPQCFLVIGKPGCGKMSLAKHISRIWNCVLINDTTVLEEALTERSTLGIQAEAILKNGEEISDSLMAEIISLKVQSSAVHNYGYVLDCLPTYNEHWKSIVEQIEYIKGFPLVPTIIINLKISDQELVKGRTSQKVDTDNIIYDCSRDHHYVNDEEEIFEEENEDKEESTVTEEVEVDIYEEDLEDVPDHNSPPFDKIDQLVRRSSDIIDCVEEEINFFSNNVLKHLEDLIVSYKRENVLEMDANLPPKELLKSFLIYMDSLGLLRCPIPLRLLDPEGEEEEEDNQGLDDEEFLKKLADASNLVPNFRWQRSRWGRYCPVQLAQGNLMQGKMEFSVGYFDKVYCMSSSDALEQFINSPRQYLSNPFPRIPCKLCILGPPTSGKSTLSRLLSQHYHAMVLDIQQLLAPILTKEKNRVIEETQQKTISSIMAKEGDGIEIDKLHPEVVKKVEEAVNSFSNNVSQELYMEALKSGINMAESRKKETDLSGSCYGGWIIDSFPMTRENWAAMIENNILPDFVICIDDERAPENFLLARFTEVHNVLSKSPEREEDISTKAPDSEVISIWQNAKSDFNRQWRQLLASIKGSGIDPFDIDCSLSIQNMVSAAVTAANSLFSLKPSEFSMNDDDADADDDPAINIENDGDEEEDDTVSEDVSWKRKAWGDTHHYCPVALKEDNIFWPGNHEIGVRYRGKLYCFSSDGAKEKFMNDPLMYTTDTKPLELPPLRIFLLGAKSSGKTSVGRYLATKLKIFHISFRSYLQEQVLPKLKKPPLVHSDEWEDDNDEKVNVNDDADINESDLKLPLTDEEGEIRSHLLNGDLLSEETILKYLEPFWFDEPYKSTGFILEDFPCKPDEMRYISDKGWYPDAAIILQIEESTVIDRVLPSRLAVWTLKRDKKIAKRKQIRDKIMHEWEEDKEKRKYDLKVEYDRKLTVNTNKISGDEKEYEDDPDVATDEYLEKIAEIDEEEMPEIEDDEDEETESNAIERMKATIIEQVEEQLESLSSLQDVFTELQVPCHSVNASRRLKVVKYSAEKVLLPYTRDRQGLLCKCVPVGADTAKKLLNHGYKHLSMFKMWCPVKLREKTPYLLPSINLYKSQRYPVIYRQNIYFMSSLSSRNIFMTNPHKYILQDTPKPAVSIALSIVGPPKSGKSTIAKRFCSEYGCVRLSIGEVLRRTITKFPQSKLSELIQSHLKAGQIVPDDLCLLALESALLDVHCSTRGYVLDGWPSTKAQVDLLTKFHIIPLCFLELTLSESEVLKRGEKDRHLSNRPQPIHDSDSILIVRSKHYEMNIEAIRKWYTYEYDNWFEIDSTHSEWFVWNQCKDHVVYCCQQIQGYLSRIRSGQAASIAGLCITPSDFKLSLGEFSEYCPVNLALNGELVDCSSFKTLKYAAEYRRKYYKMHSYEDLEKFLSTPEAFVPPNSPHPFPPPSRLPKKLNPLDIKSLFPKQFEINGFCPVCYIDGEKRYESLVSGCNEYCSEYCDKLYCFCSGLHLEKFVRKPVHYEMTDLPMKLPPLKQASSLSNLPMLGYMEQTVSAIIIDSLNATGTMKPKYPFYSSTKSALHYMGLYLKAFNTKSNMSVRQSYKAKLRSFEENCKLLDYLRSTMKCGYMEPLQRPIDFHQKISHFLDQNKP